MTTLNWRTPAWGTVNKLSVILKSFGHRPHSCSFFVIFSYLVYFPFIDVILNNIIVLSIYYGQWLITGDILAGARPRLCVCETYYVKDSFYTKTINRQKDELWSKSATREGGLTSQYEQILFPSVMVIHSCNWHLPSTQPGFTTAHTKSIGVQLLLIPLRVIKEGNNRALRVLVSSVF